MKIAFFSSKPYDTRCFEAANKPNFDLVFHEARLSIETARLAHGCDVVCAFVNDRINRATIERLAAEGVRFIALRCAGFNNVDLTAAQEHGICVARVPAYSPYAVAEHSVALALTLNRKLHRAYNRVREGNFALEGMVGFDMHGKTVGIVGTGQIGTVVARILTGFGLSRAGIRSIRKSRLRRAWRALHRSAHAVSGKRYHFAAMSFNRPDPSFDRRRGHRDDEARGYDHKHQPWCGR